MGLVQRTSPAGIDIYINNLQKQLFSSLKIKWGITDARYNCHPRCYRNQSDTGDYVAELKASGNDYNETWANDLVDVTSFFGLGVDEQIMVDNMMVANIHLIFFVDLSVIKPGDERNDSDVRGDVQYVIDHSGQAFGFKIQKVSTGLDNCLKEYSGTRKSEGLKFRDMHPFHVFRIDMQLNYQPTLIDC